jgi:hypothetical protein
MPRIGLRGAADRQAGMLSHHTLDIQVISFLIRGSETSSYAGSGGTRPVMRQLKHWYLCLGIDTLSALVTPGNTRGSQGIIW